MDPITNALAVPSMSNQFIGQIAEVPSASNGYKYVVKGKSRVEYLSASGTGFSATAKVGDRGVVVYRVTPTRGYWAWVALAADNSRPLTDK